MAFDVDQVDGFMRAGWSVLVTGEASEITSDELRMLDLSTGSRSLAQA